MPLIANGTSSIAATTATASSSETISIAASAGEIVSAGNYSGVSAALSPLASPVLSASAAGLVTMINGGQGLVTFEVTGSRTLWLADGFAVTTAVNGVFPVITFNPSDPTATESLSAVSVAISGWFRTAALSTETSFGYGKNIVSVPGAPGPGALSSAGSPVSGEFGSLAIPASVNKISLSAVSHLAIDRGLSLAVSGLARLPAPREPSGSRNRAIPAKSDVDRAHRPELTPAADLAGLTPEQSDLMTDVVPFAAGAVQQAFDRFLDQLEDLGSSTAPSSVPERPGFRAAGAWLLDDSLERCPQDLAAITQGQAAGQSRRYHLV